MSPTINVGLAQITGRPYDAEHNREHSLAAARELIDRGADLVVLPELIASGYGTEREKMLRVAESLDGQTVDAWSSLAVRTGRMIVGGFCERAGEELFNSVVAVGSSGLLLHYRKLHLFAHEKDCFTPGDLGLPIARTEFGTLGACVCYDLRFVEIARVLSLQGAELICVPTAWLPGFDKERWDDQGFCPQARNALVQSNLDQVYIACASQAGRSGNYDFLGSSIISDPYGKTIVGPLAGSSEELATAGVDLDAVSRAQERDLLINPRQDRRTDVYSLSVAGAVL